MGHRLYGNNDVMHRNPDGASGGVWCFLADQDGSMLCKVPICELELPESAEPKTPSQPTTSSQPTGRGFILGMSNDIHMYIVDDHPCHNRSGCPKFQPVLVSML